ncbi:MAG: hypothetical protein IIT72_02955 [Lachnospiraceae bacterium]|nr:hypothetical protein [Lachnospiraceae bacterium]
MTGEAILTTTESKDLHLAKEQALLHMLKDDTMIYRDYTKDRGLVRNSKEWEQIGESLRRAYVTVTEFKDEAASPEAMANLRLDLLTREFTSIARIGRQYLAQRQDVAPAIFVSERRMQRNAFVHALAALPQRGTLIGYATSRMTLTKENLGIHPEIFLIHLAKSDLGRHFFSSISPGDYSSRFHDIQNKEHFILMAVAYNILATYIASDLIDQKGSDRRACDLYRHVIAGTPQFHDLFTRQVDYLHPRESLLPDRRLWIKEQYYRSMAGSMEHHSPRSSGTTTRVLRLIEEVAKSPISL